MLDLGIEVSNSNTTICRALKLTSIWSRTQNPSAETTLEFEVAYDFDFDVCWVLSLHYLCVGVTASSSSHFSAIESKSILGIVNENFH
ncbi:hypothetical protein JHK85_052520 [Glycine max]|nr:hypothetical protein JHK85_052520 [Glycine max]